MNFGNVLTAMVTPFDQDGEVDYQATQNLINHLLANGTDGLVVTGTTGESPTLTTEEKVELYRFVVEVVDGRAPVIAGTGSNSTHASIQLTKQAEQVGVDAVMLVTPYYNKPSQEGIYRHFQAISQSTVLPILLYNIPGRSVVNTEPETIIKLSEIPNIVGVKEASGNLEAVSKIISYTPEHFSVYSGDDSLTLPMLSIGGNGVISVSSHVIGNEMQEMVTEFLNGNVQFAAEAHRTLLPIMKSLFAQPNPSPIKAALNMFGVPVGSVRLPMVPLSEAEHKELQHTLHHLLYLAS